MEKSIFFEITDVCNHICSHCCKTWRKDHYDTMNKDLLDKILSIPKKVLTISGGEPSTAIEAVRYVVEKETAPLQINTNLTLWTDEMLNLFKEKNVSLSVSVVSMNRKSYEKITSAKTYDLMVANLKKISKDSKITIIVNEENKDDILDSVTVLMVMGFHRFIIQPAIPNTEEFDKDAFMEYMKRVKEAYSLHRNATIELMSYYTHSDIPVNHLCDAGSGRLVILSNGDVVPCACMEPYILGNIMTDTLESIEDNGMKYFNSFSDEEKYICRGFLTKIGSDIHMENNDYPTPDKKILFKDIPDELNNLKVVLSHIGYLKAGRYLDLGSSMGMLYEFLPSDVYYDGVDINPQDNPMIVKADIRDFIKKAKPMYYDFVVASGCLKLMKDKEECLSFMKEVLTLLPKKFICLQKHYGIKKEEAFLDDVKDLNPFYDVKMIDEVKYSYTAKKVLTVKGILFTRRIDT